MIKDFTSYQQALKLKELGFNEQCVAFFQKEYHEVTPVMVDDNDQYRLTGWRTCKNSEIPEHYTAAPTFSQAFRFFREKYSLYHTIDKQGYWFFEIKKDEGFGDLTEVIVSYDYNSYEEAELACIDKLIEIVETK
jgi:hypothetical protein